MPIVRVFVATESQAASARRWFGRRHFPGRDQQCFALQGTRFGGAFDVIDELTTLGYTAEWIDKLSAVIVAIPRGRLDEVGQEIQKQLGFHGWPSDWVTSETRDSFGA
jgi:hypothetical protein